jgi:tRNA pseudouridine55 synthase
VLETALDRESARRSQVPPAFSALKVQGRPVHERARRGERVELPARPVEVHSLRITGAGDDTLRVRLEVSKGYYVRSFARDLGEALGVPAHLSALRRTASGPFTLERALAIDAPRDAMAAALEPIARVVERVLPVGRLTAEGALRARRGQLLDAEHFFAAPPAELAGWIDERGNVVALGRLAGERYAVERGFSQSTSSAET